jgi:hypothetical protein
LSHLIVFLSGVVVEGIGVFWVHHSERGHAFRTGACSVLQASALVLGIGESVRDALHAPAFVLGYGVGAAVAVWLKRRLYGSGSGIK